MLQQAFACLVVCIRSAVSQREDPVLFDDRLLITFIYPFSHSISSSTILVLPSKYDNVLDM